MASRPSLNCAIAVAGLLAIACADLRAGGRTITSAETAWAAIRECAALANDDSRHACTDRVLRDAGLLRSTDPAVVRRTHTGVPARTAAAESRRNPDEVEVTLASVDQGGDGKLVLTTTQGAVWRQVESDAVRPTPTRGQTMRIERAALGGFLCSTGRWVAFRCYRSR